MSSKLEEEILEVLRERKGSLDTLEVETAIADKRYDEWQSPLKRFVKKGSFLARLRFAEPPGSTRYLMHHMARKRLIICDEVDERRDYDMFSVAR